MHQQSILTTGNHFSASYEASDFCWQIGLYFLQHLRTSHITDTINCFMHLPNTFAISFFSLGFSEKKIPKYINRQPPPAIVVSKSRFLAEWG